MEGFEMKTEAQLKIAVMEELRWDPTVTSSDISVAAVLSWAMTGSIRE